MFSTHAAAEKAAMNGEGQEEYDTQFCQYLQEEIMSSPAPDAVASTIFDVQLIRDSQSSQNNTGLTGPLQKPGVGGVKVEASTSYHTSNVESQLAAHSPPNGERKPGTRKFTIRPDGKERLKLCYSNEETAGFVPGALATMDDLTQKSSMSLTQENTESAYEQFGARGIQDQSLNPNQHSSHSNHSIDHDPRHRSIDARQAKHQSVTTDSTAYTYGENDTGHLRLEYSPDEDEMGGSEDLNEPDSQDGSFAVQHVEPAMNNSYEPVTPAPPVNPFRQKGSVMKGHELFGATQPSSVGRQFTSPTSARPPSPGVYNDFISPQIRMVSSPLMRVPNIAEESPLQSSVRHILTAPLDSPHVPIARITGVYSFDQGPTLESSSRGPRPYMSMKHSQERREMNAPGSDTDESEDSDESVLNIDINPRNRKEAFEKDIKRELSAVELPRKRMAESLPEASSPAAVQVPSTSAARRRSVQEEYLTQCSGSDARDTQQDDVIVDSQAHRPPQSTAGGTTQDDVEGDGLDASEQPENHEARAPIPVPSQTITQNHLDPLGGQSPEPTLPNQNNIHTPKTSRDLPESDAAIPETSRPEDRIRPMGEVASFSKAQDENLDDIPGFTQDADFEKALGVYHSPSRQRFGVLEASSNLFIGSSPPYSTAPNIVEKQNSRPEVSGSDSKAEVPTGSSRRRQYEQEGRSSASNNLETREDVQPTNKSRLSEGTRQVECSVIDTTVTEKPEDAVPIHTELVDDRALQPIPALPQPRVSFIEGNLQPGGEQVFQQHSPGRYSLILTEEQPVDEGGNLSVTELMPKSVSSSPLSSLAPSVEYAIEEEKQHLDAQETISSESISRDLRESVHSAPQVPPLDNNNENHENNAVTAILVQVEGAVHRLPTNSQSEITDNNAITVDCSNHIKENLSLQDLAGPSPADREISMRPNKLSKAAPKAPKRTYSKRTPRGGPRKSSDAPQTTLEPEATSVNPSHPSIRNLTANLAPDVLLHNENLTSSTNPASKRTLSRKSMVITEDNKRSETPEPILATRSSKRKSGPATIDYNEQTPPRSSKRQSRAPSHRDSSEDFLALPGPSISIVEKGRQGGQGLFSTMAFAVSYVGNELNRDQITKLIVDHGGQILQEGFDCLFDTTPKSRSKDENDEMQLSLSSTATLLGFTALIADEHSRKAKYMQALALGLPCISGQWVSTCVSKSTIVDWSPYLLCAGQSSVLGNAHRSRILQPYSAADAKLVDVLEGRNKLFEGKSILLVMGKGKAASRKAYIFLTKALAPERVSQVADLVEARKRLLESEKQDVRWDILYVDGKEDAAEAADAAVFGTLPGETNRKRKRVPTAWVGDTPTPKRIRMINDQTIVESLILGQLLEE